MKLQEESTHAGCRAANVLAKVLCPLLSFLPFFQTQHPGEHDLQASRCSVNLGKHATTTWSCQSPSRLVPAVIPPSVTSQPASRPRVNTAQLILYRRRALQTRLDHIGFPPHLKQQVVLDMEDFTVSLRLGSRIVGKVAATLDTAASLADAKGSLTVAAQQVLGHSVVIKRFMVTSCGKTGYLHSHMERVPITECSPVITQTNAVVDLGIPVATQEDWNQYKLSGSPLRRSSSLNSMVSAGDHFELYYDRVVQ